MNAQAIHAEIVGKSPVIDERARRRADAATFSVVPRWYCKYHDFYDCWMQDCDPVQHWGKMDPTGSFLVECGADCRHPDCGKSPWTV